jgi:hypothetical protein
MVRGDLAATASGLFAVASACLVRGLAMAVPVSLGLGRSAALYHRSSNSYQIR